MKIPKAQIGKLTKERNVKVTIDKDTKETILFLALIVATVIGCWKLGSCAFEHNCIESCMNAKNSPSECMEVCER